MTTKYLTPGARSRMLATALRAFHALWLGASLGAVSPSFAQGAAYPEKPVRIVLSSTAGGTLDTLGRTIAEHMTKDWKQPVIVESKPGAAGMLAATAVAKAPADGYTVLFSLASVLQNTVLRRAPPYRMQELSPVSLVATMPVVLAVKADSPVKNLADLIRLSKSSKGGVSVASWGVGSTGHIISEAINQSSSAGFVHVAYKGEAEPYSDLVGGRVMAATGSPGFYLNHLKDVRIIAVGAPQRLSRMPDVPTFAEAGFPLANLSGWGGFFVPASTPTAITVKISSEIQRIVALPDVAERIRSMEYEPIGSNSADFARFIETDSALWTNVVTKGGLSLE